MKKFQGGLGIGCEIMNEPKIIKRMYTLKCPRCGNKWLGEEVCPCPKCDRPNFLNWVKEREKELR